MSGTLIKGDNCAVCISCHTNCTTCPTGLCQVNAININNMRKVNKQVRMDSSQGMMMKRVRTVSKMVGQSAHPKYLGQAGGPGDLIQAIQKSCVNPSVRYRLPVKQTRTANKNHSGVDKKHGSYSRFLARRVGGVLRKEKIPHVVAKRAIIKQPRNRTGTNSGVTPQSRISTQVKYCLNGNSRGKQGKRVMMLGTKPVVYTGYKDKVTTYDKTIAPFNNTESGNCPPSQLDNHCFNKQCCDNRIPGGKEMGKWNVECDNSKKFNCAVTTGLYGNNTQSNGGRCGCCVPVGRVKMVL